MSDSEAVTVKCPSCGAELERASASGISTHLCPDCRAPQPLREDESAFTLLGVPRKFHQDPAELQRKFYELSRALHPDRFSALGNAEWQSLSLQRMSAVNQAYQTLRKRESILDLLLEAGASNETQNASGREPARAAIPMDLAEEWFELQDLVMEDPNSAMERLEKLKHTLTERAHGFSAQLRANEEQFDRGEEGVALESMRKLRQDAAYITSMRRDIDRLEARLRGSA